MAPIKFEENIKESLEKRSITPSANSWETLSKRLDDSEGKKHKSAFWYIGIAASIAGILFLMNGLFFNTSIPVENIPTVVDSEQIDTEKTNETIAMEPDENLQSQEVVPAEKHEPATKEANSKLASQQSSSVKTQVGNYDNMKSNQTVAQNQKATILKNDYKKPISNIESNGLEEEVIEERMAINDQQHVIDSTVLNTEIETLLSEAQLQIDSEKVTRSVDANSLLRDVEDDLEQSFRDKVFESLKTNFKKVKTAVADRNN